MMDNKLDKLNDLEDLIDNLTSQKLYVEALNKCDQALEIYPEHKRIQAKKSNICYDMGNYLETY